MTDWLLARLVEPTTYAGLGGVLAAAGLHFSAAEVNGAVSILVAVASFVAMVLKEKAS